MQMRTMPVLQAMVLAHASVQLDMKKFRVKVSETSLVDTLSWVPKCMALFFVD